MANYTDKFGDSLNISDADAQKYGYTPTVLANSGIATNSPSGTTGAPLSTYDNGVSQQNPTGITADSLKQATPITLPNATPTPAGAADATVAGAGSTLSSIITSLTPPPTEADQKSQSILDSIAGLTGQDANKGADQLAAENTAGIPDLKKHFSDLNAQVLSKTAELTASDAANSQTDASLEGQGRGIVKGIITGQQAANDRVYQTARTAKAAEIGLLQAQAQGLQGQIGIAQDTVNRSIDLKYSTIDNQINTYQAQLNALKPTLDKEGQIRAAAQQTLLDQQKQKIADAKQTEKDQTKFVIDLASKYPDAGIQITDSPTVAQSKVPTSKIYQQATRLAGGTNPIPPTPVTPTPKTTVIISDIVKPYLNTSNSGVQYVDASTLQGTATDKTKIINTAQAEGLKIITNKNTAADLSNIQDANNKLDTIQGIIGNLAQPNWLSRTLGGLGLTKLATLTQSDPQKAAAGALQTVGLDMLKAISGVQGFRGNQTAIQQINDHLPSIYDTKDVVNQKISYLRQLITDRENGILGTSSENNTHNGVILPQSNNTFNGINLPH